MRTIYVSADFLEQLRKELNPRDLFFNVDLEDAGTKNLLMLSYSAQEQVCFVEKPHK